MLIRNQFTRNFGHSLMSLKLSLFLIFTSWCNFFFRFDLVKTLNFTQTMFHLQYYFTLQFFFCKTYFSQPATHRRAILNLVICGWQLFSSLPSHAEKVFWNKLCSIIQLSCEYELRQDFKSFKVITQTLITSSINVNTKIIKHFY